MSSNTTTTLTAITAAQQQSSPQQDIELHPRLDDTNSTVPPEHESPHRISIGTFSPNVLQFFNTPKWFSVFAFTATLIVNFTSASILFVGANTLEKQFGITSAQFGLLSIAYTITVGFAGVIVGHLCKLNKPRWIRLVKEFLYCQYGVVPSLPEYDSYYTYDNSVHSAHNRSIIRFK